MTQKQTSKSAPSAGAFRLLAGAGLVLASCGTTGSIHGGSPSAWSQGAAPTGFMVAEAPSQGASPADLGGTWTFGRCTERLLEVLTGEGFAKPNPRPMFPNPPGLLRVEPHSEGLRERIWWGSGSNATAVWAAKLGMNLQSSTLKDDESGKPFHIQQAEQIALYRQAWEDAGHEREPRVSVSRSIFALTDERDWHYFGRDRRSSDQVGNIDAKTRAIFGRSYAGAPDELAAKLAEDEAIAAADTLLLTVPNQLGVDYNAHVIDSILKHVAPQLGWR